MKQTILARKIIEQKIIEQQAYFVSKIKRKLPARNNDWWFFVAIGIIGVAIIILLK
jgi:hypothetical protein